MLTCILDGQTIEVEPGTTILTAARAVGIDIPTFCFHERLSLSASCRMCLVEIEGRNKLEPACATAISPDMVISTQTDKVAGTREDMLEILLANHPLDCPVCDKGGECELQDTVFRYGKGDSRLRDPKRVFRKRDIELNKVIVFNANRCIQCQRCVRVCEEVVGDVALGTAERGLDSEITGVGNSLTDCSHCGNCIEVCPVGALMSVPYRYKARPWDMVKTETICGICGTGCSLTAETRDGDFKRVKSDPETGINGELLCTKGRFGFGAIDAGRRVTEPMIRKNGALEPVGWSEAIQCIANKIRAIKDVDGRIQGQVSASQINETAFMFQRLLRQVLETQDIHSSTRFKGLCSQDAKNALAYLVTQIIDRKPLETLMKADCIFVLGANVTDENPVSGYLLRTAMKDPSKHLMIASSRPCGLDNIADAFCRLRPGNEAHLLSHMITGVPVLPNQALNDFAASTGQVLGAADNITLLIGTELMRCSGAAEGLQWVSLAAEHFKSQGKMVSVQFLFDRPNQLGLWDVGCLSGYSPGWQPCEFQPANRDKPLALQYILGSNATGGGLIKPENGSAPDKPDYLIVHSSHFNATTALADVVLPAPSMNEEAGSFTNNEGRVQSPHPVYAPYHGVLPTVQVFSLISQALEHGSMPCDLGDIRDLIAAECRDYGVFDQDYSVTSSKHKTPPTAPALWFEECSLRQDQRYLLTGDSLFQSAQFSEPTSLVPSLDNGPYVEMNPGAGPDHAFDDMTATLCSDGGSFTAPIRINRSLDEQTVFVPEVFLIDLVNDTLCLGDYPWIVEIALSGKSPDQTAR